MIKKKKKLKITPLAKTVEPTVCACTEAQKSKEKSVGFVDWRFDRKIGLGVCRFTSTHRHCHRPYTRLIINKNYFHDSIIKRDCFLFFFALIVMCLRSLRVHRTAQVEHTYSSFLPTPSHAPFITLESNTSHSTLRLHVLFSSRCQ